MDVIVFSVGSNGGGKDITKAIDGNGVETAIQAARLAGKFWNSTPVRHPLRRR